MTAPEPAKASTPALARGCLPAWLLGVLLALATVGLYWPATHHDFVDYDDGQYVLANPHVSSGLTLENVRWAFRSGYGGTWHPLTWLSHMVDCQLFGLRPWGHHLTAVLLHALNAALVFALLRQLTGATWRCFWVAALFAVHPLRVESVAWVAERKDVLSGCFGLLSLIAYTRYAQVRSRVERLALAAPAVKTPNPCCASLDYGIAWFCLALGLMSKPMLVTWPWVMLLLDYWPLERFRPGRGRRLVLEKVPFLALAAAASVVTVLVQKHGGAMMTAAQLPIDARCGNALVSGCRYLGKIFWPTHLAVFYPYPGPWPLEKLLLAGGLIVGVSVLVVAKRQRYPFLVTGWLWFCVTLVPVIGLVQVGRQAMADRYTYLPSLGVLVLAVWGVCAWTRRWRHQAMVLSVAGAVVTMVCMGLTRQQLGFWQDSGSLFRRALAVTENNYLACNNIGVLLGKQGQIGQAIGQFREAIRIKPDYAEAHYNLGFALDRQGQTGEGIDQYQEAIRLKPDDAKAHYYLGLALGRQGQTAAAIVPFQEAVRLQPEDADAHYSLGMALYGEAQGAEAIRQLQEVIRLKPDHASALNTLGYLWAERGENLEPARALVERAVQLEPGNAAYLDSLGRVLLKLNRPREALEFQLRAIACSARPDAALYDHLGDIYGALNLAGQAAEAWRKALSVAPHPQVQQKLRALPAQ